MNNLEDNKARDEEAEKLRRKLDEMSDYEEFPEVPPFDYLSPNIIIIVSYIGGLIFGYYYYVGW